MKNPSSIYREKKSATRSRRTDSLVQLSGDRWTEHPRAVYSSSSPAGWFSGLEAAETRIRKFASALWIGGLVRRYEPLGSSSSGRLSCFQWFDDCWSSHPRACFGSFSPAAWTGILDRWLLHFSSFAFLQAPLYSPFASTELPVAPST
ncbi:unnamed protein product [Cochlearia groenlandica]